MKLINKNTLKLKILGSGQIKAKINIEADLASKSAVEKLEKIGGSIQLRKWIIFKWVLHHQTPI